MPGAGALAIVPSVDFSIDIVPAPATYQPRPSCACAVAGATASNSKHPMVAGLLPAPRKYLPSPLLLFPDAEAAPGLRIGRRGLQGQHPEADGSLTKA